MNNMKNKLIPELRFPEFANDGEWLEGIIENITIPESSSIALNKLELKKEGYPVYGADSIVGFIDSYQHNDNYISIVKDGSGVGRLNLVQQKSTILGTLIALKSKDVKKYELNWIYYYLNTIDFTSYIKGAGIPHIYYSDYKNEKVLIPKPKEQQKIASCLSYLDEAITAHTDKLKTLKTYKKGLMQNLFPQDGEKIPKLRFKEFEKDGDWEESRLGDIAENFDYKRVPITSNQREKGNVPYYGASGIIDYVKGYIYDEKLLCISEDGANLIDRSYPIAFTINGKTWVNNHAHVLKFENENTQILVENYINSINIQDFLTGMAQPKLNRGKLDIIPISLPINPKEQQKIAETLCTLDEIIKEQTTKIDQLRSHKKGLIQGLFPRILK
jgi:type I restriction enzyme S subunit